MNDGDIREKPCFHGLRRNQLQIPFLIVRTLLIP
jgi:hypothetical protein